MHIKKTTILFSTLVLVIGASLALALRPSPATAPARQKSVLVSLTTARQQDLPLELSAQGHLVALNQVEVRPQLTATILAIHFKEGDDVKAGQLLFTLDDADARAQLQRTEAQVAQIQAQLADAERDHHRSSELVQSHFIAPSAVDTAASKVDALRAQLKAARADVDSTRQLMLHTRILAPVAARTGAVAVHPGSLAQTSASAPLVTLVQFNPIGVEFNLPEQHLAALLRARAQGPVRVLIDGPDGRPVQGELTFINNVVNTDTGTISLKASLPNAAGTLWPGAYARVTVLAGSDKNAVVLPPQAVLEGPDGRFVFLAGPDNKVVRQPVTLLRVQDGLAVVAGVASGSRVVQEGGANLRTGDAIQVDANAPSPASAVRSAP